MFFMLLMRLFFIVFFFFGVLGGDYDCFLGFGNVGGFRFWGFGGVYWSVNYLGIGGELDGFLLLSLGVGRWNCKIGGLVMFLLNLLGGLISNFIFDLFFLFMFGRELGEFFLLWIF